jgi:hypothetical protein
MLSAVFYIGCKVQSTRFYKEIEMYAAHTKGFKKEGSFDICILPFITTAKKSVLLMTAMQCSQHKFKITEMVCIM